MNNVCLAHLYKSLTFRKFVVLFAMKFTSIAAIATALLAAVDTVSAQVYFWPIPKEGE
jgi:hypothetical protein